VTKQADEKLATELKGDRTAIGSVPGSLDWPVHDIAIANILW